MTADTNHTGAVNQSPQSDHGAAEREGLEKVAAVIEMAIADFYPAWERKPDFARFIADRLAAPTAPQEADRVREESVADQIIRKIEERFPNWRSFRDLIDCIDCTLHELRKG